jgi:RNA polymerase sigma-70 factor (ECF subfamily)
MSQSINFGKLSSTVNSAGVDAAPAEWESKLVAFEQASEQYRAQLLWQAQRFTPFREEAEDIVQEALYRAFKNLPQFRGDSQMSTWLHVIVRNIGREWLRHRKGRVCLQLEHAPNRENEPQVLDVPDPGRNPEQFCEWKEIESILLLEIEDLNAGCKRAIQMCALEELSQREAAKSLGINVFTVKSRILHGKRMLRRAICLRTGERDGLSGFIEPALWQSIMRGEEWENSPVWNVRTVWTATGLLSSRRIHGSAIGIMHSISKAEDEKRADYEFPPEPPPNRRSSRTRVFRPFPP